MGDTLALLGFGEGAWGPALAQGAWVTIRIAVTAYLLGLLIGLFGALAKRHGNRPVRAVAEGYTTMVRGIPDILIILLVYYGGTSALKDLTALVMPGVVIEINPFAAAVASLGVICGAYATEIFRGSIQAVPEGQWEAARALGLRGGVTFFKVILPQAMRYAVPALGNLWLVVMKDSALISVVGIRDLLGIAQTGAARTREPFTFYFTVALIFLVLTVVSMIAFHFAERRFSRGHTGR